MAGVIFADPMPFLSPNSTSKLLKEDYKLNMKDKMDCRKQ